MWQLQIKILKDKESIDRKCYYKSRHQQTKSLVKSPKLILKKEEKEI